MKKLKTNLYILSLLAIIILSFYLIHYLKIYNLCCIILDVLLPLLFGYIFAWMLYPLYNKLNKKFPKKISLTLLILAFIIVYGFILWQILPILINNISSISNMFNDIINRLSGYPFLQSLEQYKNIDIGVLLNSCSNILSYIIIFGLSHIFGFYILFTYKEINAFFKNSIPKKYKKMYTKYISNLSSNMRLYLKGTLLDMIILFIASSLIYFFLGLKYSLFLGLFSAITNVIPFIGPYIGGIPAVLIALSTNINLGILTIISIVIIQVIESNVVNPMIMSKCIKINPIFIIVTLSIMGKFFGLIGMIFAVPLLILIKVSTPYINEIKGSLKILDKGDQKA